MRLQNFNLKTLIILKQAIYGIEHLILSGGIEFV